MEAPSGRIFTPARIVALVVISILIAVLAYMQFTPGSHSVSVPEGARAGDVFLQNCRYATENGPYEADCGTLVVPENRKDPQSRLIALPITRIRARSERPGEPIFRLEGGPGTSNMKFEVASRFAENHDVVLVGYRGVDGSVRLDCPEVEKAIGNSKAILSERSFRAYDDAYKDCATRLTDDGVYLPGYGLAAQVDDLEAAREALGYDRINLVSESAGTRTAIIYSWRYPNSIHRSVMIGVNPPGNYMFDAKITDEQIGRYAALCSKDAECSKRTDDLAATLQETAAKIPDHWLFLPIKSGNVRVASFFGLMESSSEATPYAGPVILDVWLSAAEGDASGFWLGSLFGDLLFPKLFVWGQYAAAATGDAQAVRDYFASGWQEGEENLGRAATAFAWGGGLLANAWPAAQDDADYSRVRTSTVETLLISGELDFSTPPQIAARELVPFMPNGRQVVLGGFGHTLSFWNVQSEAGTHLINTFFDNGGVDDSLYKPGTVDLTPGLTFTAIAKVVAGAMIGFALFAVLSLAWMARRVQQRRGFGRKTTVALRSVYLVPLGLGAWCLGALLVMTVSLAVRLDSQLLAVLFAGAPVGLGVYLAWVHGEWETRTKVTGLAAAVAGALLGAWMGHEAADGLTTILGTVVGAAAGVNLILIGLDITWELSSRRSAAAVTPATSTRATAS